MKLRGLNLFCCAGGSCEGMRRAGFEVVSVDILPQPHHRGGSFMQADAIEVLRDRVFCRSFDFIWASPPCQGYSALRHAPGAKKHAKLIAPVRELLCAIGRPYVIENVEEARDDMRNPVMLCGSHFDLGVRVDSVNYQLQRHRLFEANFPIPQPECAHMSATVGVYGGHARCRSAAHGGRGTRDFVGHSQRSIASVAMGIDWMTLAEMSQAIPPVYAEFIAKNAIRHIRGSR